MSLWLHSKYYPWEAMKRRQHLVNPSKQFWNVLSGLAIRTVIVLSLINWVSSKCLPFNIFFHFGIKREGIGSHIRWVGWVSDTVICLPAKNILTENALWAGALSWWKSHELLSISSGRFCFNFFTQPFNSSKSRTWLTVYPVGTNL